MFRATNALAFKGVHLLGSQSVDYRLIVHGLIVTFTLGKATRKALNLSQEALALETDIDRTYISGIKRAKRNPSLELIVKLAKRLKTTPGKLLTPTD
jgi:DNA-binding XRE family transcriptional regulator